MRGTRIHGDQGLGAREQRDEARDRQTPCDIVDSLDAGERRDRLVQGMLGTGPQQYDRMPWSIPAQLLNDRSPSLWRPIFMIDREPLGSATHRSFVAD